MTKRDALLRLSCWAGLAAVLGAAPPPAPPTTPPRPTAPRKRALPWRERPVAVIMGAVLGALGWALVGAGAGAGLGGALVRPRATSSPLPPP